MFLLKQFKLSFELMQQEPVAIRGINLLIHNCWHIIDSATVLSDGKVELGLYPIYKSRIITDSVKKFEYKLNMDRHIRVLEPGYYSVSDLQNYVKNLPSYSLLSDFVDFTEEQYDNNIETIKNLIDSYPEVIKFIKDYKNKEWSYG